MADPQLDSDSWAAPLRMSQDVVSLLSSDDESHAAADTPPARRRAARRPGEGDEEDGEVNDRDNHDDHDDRDNHDETAATVAVAAGDIAGERVAGATGDAAAVELKRRRRRVRKARELRKGEAKDVDEVVEVESDGSGDDRGEQDLARSEQAEILRTPTRNKRVTAKMAVDLCASDGRSTVVKSSRKQAVVDLSCATASASKQLIKNVVATRSPIQFPSDDVKGTNFVERKSLGRTAATNNSNDDLGLRDSSDDDDDIFKLNLGGSSGIRRKRSLSCDLGAGLQKIKRNANGTSFRGTTASSSSSSLSGGVFSRSPGGFEVRRSHTIESFSPSRPRGGVGGGSNSTKQVPKALNTTKTLATTSKPETANQRKARHARETRVGRLVASGKFATQETRVLIDKAFAKTPGGLAIAGQCVANEWAFSTIETGVPGMVLFEHTSWLPSEDNPDPVALKVGKDKDKNKPVQDTGRAASLVSNALLVFWPKDDFAERLCSETEGYGQLVEVVTRARRCWQELADRRPKSKLTKARPKVVLVLAGAEDALTLRQKELARKARGGEVVTSAVKARQCPEGMRDALSWLLASHAVEHRVIADTPDATQALFAVYFRAVAAALHYELPSALETSHLYKRFQSIADDVANPAAASGGASSDEAEARRAAVRVAWISMLQCIMGETQARNIARHYPTLRSLLEAYDDPTRSEQDKEELVAHVANPGRRMIAVSRRLYTYYSSNDPDKVVRGGE